MLTLSDVLADADFDALAEMVTGALEEMQEEIDVQIAEGILPTFRLDTVTTSPDMDGIGQVLEMDQLHPEDCKAAHGWYRDAWADVAHAALSMGDSLRMGAA